MKYEYPCVFYDDDGQIAFHFYDREDWFLSGENISAAIEMAADVLNGALLAMEREGQEIPAATPLSEVEVKPQEVVKLIRADTEKYALELAAMSDREAILNAAIPIKELMTRQHLRIKDLSDKLEIPYRTVQDWSLGKSKPPTWTLKLIVEKILGQ